MASNFTVRVELHDAKTWQDYENLHNQMALEGFGRTIRGDDGVTYELPSAEYVMTGDFTIKQVLEKAKRAAAKTGKKFAVLVSETLRWMWFGLKVVQ
jgi:hypothetical protein